MNKYPDDISKRNLAHEKQIILFNDFKWRRVVLSCSKILSTLLRVITSKHDDDFHCLNCFHSFKKINLESHKKRYEKIKVFAIL